MYKYSDQQEGTSVKALKLTDEYSTNQTMTDIYYRQLTLEDMKELLLKRAQDEKVMPLSKEGYKNNIISHFLKLGYLVSSENGEQIKVTDKIFEWLPLLKYIHVTRREAEVIGHLVRKGYLTILGRDIENDTTQIEITFKGMQKVSEITGCKEPKAEDYDF